MTDKELIELAAKAAGITGTWHRSGYVAYSGWSSSIFDPLNDDGDALRLAVKLKISIVVNGVFVHAEMHHCEIGDLGFMEENAYRNGGDMMKATRVVITRAAAMIGEEMQ